MKLLHRLWLKINDIGEYDVKYGAWKIYQIMYTNNLIKGGNLFTDKTSLKKAEDHILNVNLYIMESPRRK